MLNTKTDAELIDYAKDNIIFVDHVNHNKLFPKCSCIVSHGGAGTTAAMIRSGRPCIVTPVWWDQVFFGDRLEAIGCGKRGPHFAKLTGDKLAELIKDVTTDGSYAAKAKEVREKLMSEKPGDIVVADRAHSEIM